MYFGSHCVAIIGCATYEMLAISSDLPRLRLYLSYGVNSLPL